MCANASARKGANFELSLLPLLVTHYGEDNVVRLGKQGVKDKGDYHIVGEKRFIIEAKREASYGGKLAGWLTEAAREADCAGKPIGVVAHKRHGIALPDRQYLTLELGDFLNLVKPL
jgi:hypothetical protein